MGLWSNFKNFLQNIGRKRLNKGQEAPKENNFAGKEIEISSNGDSIYIESLESEHDFVHRNNHITHLMVATIYNTHINRDNALMKENQNFVAFEVPAGTTIDDVILKKMAHYYAYERKTKNQDECVYIGEINADQNDYTIQKHSSSEKHVKYSLSRELSDRKQAHQEKVNQQFKTAQQENQAYHNNSFEVLNAQTQELRKQEDRERNQRKENPYIRQSKPFDQLYQTHTLEGINVETGEFLRIGQLKKVGKDETGRYLYTANLNNVSNRNAAEIEDPVGVPVCFAIDKRVTDIVAENNPYEVKKLLELFSQESIYRNDNHYMNYIGTLDKYGNITHGETDSQTIKYHIDMLKDKAKDEMVKAQAELKKYNPNYSSSSDPRQD